MFFIFCRIIRTSTLIFFFFFNDTATTEIYTLSLTTLFRSAWAISSPNRADDQPAPAGRPVAAPARGPHPGHQRGALLSLRPGCRQPRLRPQLDRLGQVHRRAHPLPGRGDLRGYPLRRLRRLWRGGPGALVLRRADPRRPAHRLSRPAPPT